MKKTWAIVVLIFGSVATLIGIAVEFVYLSFASISQADGFDPSKQVWYLTILLFGVLLLAMGAGLLVSGVGRLQQSTRRSYR